MNNFGERVSFIWGVADLIRGTFKRGNSSPLFTSDEGSGESEIRRWILENDWGS